MMLGCKGSLLAPWIAWQITVDVEWPAYLAPSRWVVASRRISVGRRPAAARTSLAHRGDGAGPDANAGWEKMWRAAAWAQLGDAERFYHQLTVSGRGGVVDEAVADSRSHFRLHLHLSLVVRHCHELRS